MTKQQYILITTRSPRSGARHTGQIHKFPADRKEVAQTIRYARKRNFPIIKKRNGYDIGTERFVFAK